MADELLPDEYFVAGDVEEDVPQPASDKKAGKKKKSGKDRPRIDLAGLDAEQAGAYLLEKFKTANAGLSSLELKKYQSVPDAVVKVCGGSSFSKVLANLPDFSSICKEKKCQVLVLTGSAIRAVEVLRLLPNVREKCTIGKLFAKHIKMKDQLAFLASRHVPVAIGTPGRVKAIAEEAAPHFDQVRYIIIDVERDTKLRSIFDIPETLSPLLGIIFNQMLEAISTGRIKLIFAC